MWAEVETINNVYMWFHYSELANLTGFSEIELNNKMNKLCKPCEIETTCIINYDADKQVSF